MELKEITKKPLYLGLIVVIVAAILGGAYWAVSGSGGLVVANGDTVQVYYTGSLANGMIFNTNVGNNNQSLQFTIGANEVIPGFEQAVIGMKVNQTKTVTIPVNEAYGPVNPQLIIQVPLSSFGNQSVKVGTVARETSGGKQAQGIVTAVNATDATVNFNSPLAGQVLIFKITVVGIQSKQ